MLPIPDAALGALGYLADAVFGLAGGTVRWSTQPWLVIVFAIAVIPFGVTSVTLFILQPVFYNTLVHAVPAFGRDLTGDGAVRVGRIRRQLAVGCAGASTLASVYGMRFADGNETRMRRRIGDN